jgi:hypothetical protein
MSYFSSVCSTAGSSMTLRNASCSALTIAGSMPFEPHTPNGESDTVSKPSSFNVGMFGQRRVRLLP